MISNQHHSNKKAGPMLQCCWASELNFKSKFGFAKIPKWI